MKYFFPRYVYGMLQTQDKKNVYGDLQPIAYSREFSGNLQRDVYKKVRLGLNGELLQESRHAYGFFSLNDNDYIAAHYELMDLTELTSRGKPVFSEFLHITLSQLQDIDWNLLPIFESFTNISYYGQIVEDILPIEIDFHSNGQRLETFHQFPMQVEAILVRYLSSSEKINIVSSPHDNNIRLKILCELFQYLPLKYRKDLSFATLAKENTDSVRVFFTSQASINGQIVDWSAPTIPNLSGIVYTNWLEELVKVSKTGEIKNRISDLLLPWKTDHLKTYGDEVDLAVRYRDWSSNKNIHLKIKVLAQLEQLAKQINEFSCIFKGQEAEDWLSALLIFVMKLTAYDVGAESLSYYMYMIADDKARQKLVKKIVDGIFLQKIEGEVKTLAGFIIYITEHGIKTNQNVLLDLCQEILLQCLVSENHTKALRLWNEVKDIEWASSPIWFEEALEKLPKTLAKEDFIFLVDDIGCPANRKVFEALRAILKKSHVLSVHFPENLLFLESLDFEEPQNYLEHISGSFLEVRSYKWLSTQIKFGYESFANFSESLPFLMSEVGIAISHNLQRYVASEEDDFLSALISVSIILSQIKQGELKLTDLNKYLSIIAESRPENIKVGLEILQKYWGYFSVEQLELILNLLDAKSLRFKNINISVLEIRSAIQKKNRIKRIHNMFNTRKRMNNLEYVIFEFVSDFSRSADVESWHLFEKYIREYGYLNEYHVLLIQILVDHKFFRIDDDKLKNILILLTNAGLQYEADVFMYWLFFREGLLVNPVSTISRTLSLFCVLPAEAGIIIGQEFTFNKKHARKLAHNLSKMAPIEAGGLVEKLDLFLSTQSTSSIENRLRALVSDLTPDEIWHENCKSLSKNIKAELRKT